MTEETAIYKTLDALVSAEGKEIDTTGEKPLRAYEVQLPGGEPRYVTANSPGQAAMKVCKVTLCKQRDVLNAALRNTSKKEK
jgi:hypothetical protein